MATIAELKDALARATEATEYEKLKKQIDAMEKAESLARARADRDAEERAAAELAEKLRQFEADKAYIFALAEQAQLLNEDMLLQVGELITVCEKRSKLMRAADNLRADLKVRAVALGISPFEVPGRGGYEDPAGAATADAADLAKAWVNRYLDHLKILERRAAEDGKEPAPITVDLMRRAVI